MAESRKKKEKVFVVSSSRRTSKNPLPDKYMEKVMKPTPENISSLPKAHRDVTIFILKEERKQSEKLFKAKPKSKSEQKELKNTNPTQEKRRKTF